MELIKDIMKQYYPLLILLSCVLFVINVFFTDTIYKGRGIFEGGGTLFAPMLESTEVTNDGLTYIADNGNGYVPSVSYNSGAKKVFDCVTFKELLLIHNEDGSTTAGNVEDTFAIYLKDIRNKDGNSVLEMFSAEDIANMEEIPAAFVYDKENDLLYIYGSGVYTVHIKIFSDGGGMEEYVFQLPVEPS